MHIAFTSLISFSLGLYLASAWNLITHSGGMHFIDFPLIVPTTVSDSFGYAVTYTLFPLSSNANVWTSTSCSPSLKTKFQSLVSSRPTSLYPLSPQTPKESYPGQWTYSNCIVHSMKRLISQQSQQGKLF